MNRRDMVFETCLALFAVAGIVVGNFVVQRWWSAGSSARVADAAAHQNAQSSSQPVAASAEDDFVPPTRHRPHSGNDQARQRQRLKQLIAEQLPNASDEQRDAWLAELQDVPLEVASGILQTRTQVGGLTDPESESLLKVEPTTVAPESAEPFRRLGIEISR